MGVTLDLYIARRFAASVLAAFATVMVLTVLVDLVELIRDNSAGRAGFGDLVGLALLHAPSLTVTTAPFTILLAALLCFTVLDRASEVIVMRAAGVSLARLVAPAMTIALVLAVFSVLAYQPLAALFAARYETLREHYFHPGRSRLTVSADGVWLRQGGDRGQLVIRARRAVGDIGRLSLVTVFRFDDTNRLTERIDARAALLEPGAWRFTEARRWHFPDVDLGSSREAATVTRAAGPSELRVPTDLTIDKIEESFAAPRTIPFWKLPRFIGLLERAGFSASRHRLHFHRLLALPLVFVAMVLIGGAFATQPARSGGLGRMALACVLTGFAYFTLSDITQALGASDTVPAAAAAWAPPLAALLLALGLLLHREEG